MAVSPDRRLLALVEERQGDVWLWDLERRVKVGVLRGHTEWTDALAFSPDSRLLATGSLDWRIKLWRISREAPAAGLGPGDGSVWAEKPKTLEGHNNAVACVVFSPDGKRMASVGDDRLVKIWDPSTGETLAVLSTPGGNTYTLSFSPDGQLLVAGSQTARGTGEAIIWRAATEAEVQARRNLESSWQR
jgi:WD40 repeat protein